MGHFLGTNLYIFQGGNYIHKRTLLDQLDNTQEIHY